MGTILRKPDKAEAMNQNGNEVARVLYITYDGLMEPLGQSQVFQYLRNLARKHEITLVSYEKPQDWSDIAQRHEVIDKARQAGIRWVPLRYHKRPTAPATAYDLAVGLIVCAYLVLRYRIQIVHARSYVPSVVALSLKRIFGTRFIFDMRGFWPDEKVEGGHWSKESRLYKVAKWFEQHFLTQADVVVSLTHAGVATMREFPYLQEKMPRFEVIPTCTNLEIFHPMLSAHTGQVKPFTIGYVGTVGNWYLFDPALECFKILREIRPDAQMLIVNRGEHTYIRERLAAHGISEDWVEIKTVAWAKVVEEMSRMDAGIFFIKPVYSKRGSAATKLGEFLGCGIPCLSNAGVGDMEKILEGEDVGVVLREFSQPAQAVAVQRLLELVADAQIRERCVAVARRYFSLEDGVESYNRIYKYILCESSQLN
jgi:glycosyltransferase involved in cell wall biosynthesis